MQKRNFFEKKEKKCNLLQKVAVKKSRCFTKKYNFMEILVPISFFATIFGVMYMHYTTRHKERIALIEKGTDASVFYSNRLKGKFYSLQFGILAVCIGLGILLGNLLHQAGLQEEVAYNSMVFLMGGVGLIIFHILNLKYQKEKNQEEKS